MTSRRRPPWNHNIHYFGRLDAAVPPGARRVVDVGCGEGLLAARLSSRVPLVVALDVDGPALRLAAGAAGGARLVRADVLAAPLAPGTLDAVVSVATLHHIDEAAGLRRMAELLRPGGVLAVVGLARAELPRDLGWELAGMVAGRVLRALRGETPVQAPTVWPPPRTYRQVRRLAEEVLPGVRYRRHLLWRYSLVWTKPAGEAVRPGPAARRGSAPAARDAGPAPRRRA